MFDPRFRTDSADYPEKEVGALQYPPVSELRDLHQNLVLESSIELQELQEPSSPTVSELTEVRQNSFDNSHPPRPGSETLTYGHYGDAAVVIKAARTLMQMRGDNDTLAAALTVLELSRGIGTSASKEESLGSPTMQITDISDTEDEKVESPTQQSMRVSDSDDKQLGSPMKLVDVPDSKVDGPGKPPERLTNDLIVVEVPQQVLMEPLNRRITVKPWKGKRSRKQSSEGVKKRNARKSKNRIGNIVAKSAGHDNQMIGEAAATGPKYIYNTRSKRH
ncbi:hypothetical protein WAI453_004950 [Rhynchosporium graminicola]